VKEPKASEELFQQIVSNSQRTKSVNAIRNIKQACDYLEEKGIGITVSEVGKLCENSTPNTQSIRNNKNFKNYVLARTSEQNRNPSKKVRESIPLRTGNPQWDAEIEVLEANLRFQRREFQQLKKAVEGMGDYDLSKTIETGKLVPASPSAPDHSEAYDEALQTIERLFDPGNLEQFGFELINGRIISIDRNEAVFVSKVDLARIQKAIDATRSRFLALTSKD
jgi:hypothetical protein